MAKIPAFARASNIEILENALYDEEGILYDLDRICYIFVDDGDRFAYIDPNKQIHLIKGNNKVVVQNVTTLPPASEADPEVLYICNNIVYVWDTAEQTYKPTFYEIAIQLDNLTAQLNNIETHVGSLDESIDDIEQRIVNFENAIDAINSNLADIVDDITALEQTKANKDNVYTKSEVDALLEVETPGGAMTIPEYVDASVADAVQTAQDYTDQLFELNFV